MGYYVSTTLDRGFDEAIPIVVEALKSQGFGVLTEIDVQATLKKKLGVDFRRYQILGTCNPHFAHRALELEDKIGLMLPCNVIVQELGDGRVEVAAIDPLASMQAVKNAALAEVGTDVRRKLALVIEAIRSS